MIDELEKVCTPVVELLRRELEANAYGIENADRVLKKNYHGKRRVGSNG